VQELRQQAQRLPSRDPHDPDCRRLWYVRYADDMLLGLTGSQGEAEAIKQQLTPDRRAALHLDLRAEKTLVIQAREARARFLGYEVHVLHADDKDDHRGQRCLNGSIGLRVPPRVHQAKRARYMRRDKPSPLPERTIADAYSIVAPYRAEYRGVVQDYRRAYNLHVLSHLKYVMEVALVQTCAKQSKTTCPTIYKRYGATMDTKAGPRRVLRVTIERDPPTSPFTTHCGGVSLQWHQWAYRNDAPTTPVWSGRREVVERLLAHICALCGSQEHIEVHHIRKLADLASTTGDQPPRWQRRMVARQRKTLAVCRSCHERMQYGHYDGPALRRSGYRRAS
jgi:hypothetical protein